MRIPKTDPGGMSAPIHPAPIKRKVGEPLHVRLMSDIHIPAQEVDYELIYRELDEARELGARILINGDLFDAILAKDMKRYQPDVVFEEHQGRRDVLNAALDFALEMLAPYADLIDAIGLGNHETSVERFHSIDLVSMLIPRLQEYARKRVRDHVIHHSHIQATVHYKIVCADKQERVLSIWMGHGSGGGGPVTKGMINFNRLATFISGVDVVWIGHLHHRWASHVKELRMSPDLKSHVWHDVWHILTGAYMNVYTDQESADTLSKGRKTNYNAELHRAPAGLGGARLEVVPVGKAEAKHHPTLKRVRVIQ